MKFRTALSALVVGVLATGSGQAAPLYSDVVLGNLNSDGSKSLGATSATIGPGGGLEIWVAQGFNTGTSSDLSLKSVLLGLLSPSGTTSATALLYSNSGGSPGTLLYTSSAVNVSGGTQATYEFPFSNATLTANTSYWIVPNAGVQWFQVASVGGTPIAQNGSAYSYIGAIESDTTDISPGEWAASVVRYSVSVQAVAVPEPSTYVLASIGLGIAGLIKARRRSKARG